MSSSVLRELEDLRVLLRSPRPTLAAGHLGMAPSEAPSTLPKQYADVLKTAEAGFKAVEPARRWLSRNAVAA